MSSPENNSFRPQARARTRISHRVRASRDIFNTFINILRIHTHARTSEHAITSNRTRGIRHMPAVHVAIAGRHSRADGDDAHLNPSALRREHFFVRACVSSEAVRPGRRRRRCVRVRLCFVWWSTNACVSSLKTPKRNDYNIYIGLRLGSERTSGRMHDMLHETEYALRVCIYVCSIFNMLQHRFWDWHRTHADAHAETRTRHDTPATNLNSNISMRVHLCDSRKSCACVRACVFVRVVVHCRARARARMRAYVCVCVCSWNIDAEVWSDPGI